MLKNPGPIYDPIYGAIYTSDLEEKLILSRPMQRLRGIKQLGLVDAVYPGANHTRFEHSLGTMHMAGRMALHIGLDPGEVKTVRAAGLLHDIGHAAFSHAVEGVLSRNPEIQPMIGDKQVFNHEAFTRELISSHPFGDAVSAAEKEFGDADEFFQEVSQIALGRKAPLGQVISGDLDADRIDFLLRDSHHSGVDLGLIDADQIIQALVISTGCIVLTGRDDYRSEMSVTAAESMLISRAHHYNALIHNPQVQSLRAMLLSALESALEGMEPEEARSRMVLFFKEYTDADLLRFIWDNGDYGARGLLERIKFGESYPLGARFDQRFLPPGVRMAISTISRVGRVRKIFEDGLRKRYGCLVDISVGSGVPKSIRTEGDGFLYDESSLAAGLVKSLTRQISISFFSDSPVEASLEAMKDQAFRLLQFIRSESYLPIEGILILFYALHRILSEAFEDRVLVPRIRNITWIYRTIKDLKEQGGLSGLYYYSFHQDYGFPYSEKLFEDLQVLVAMGMVYQDQRHYEIKGRWLQRYEYMLTPEGLSYAKVVARSYEKEAEAAERLLRQEKHTIPYDKVSLHLRRYTEGKS
jgi:uncharacterized protein